MEDRIETLHMIVKYDVVNLISKISCYCEEYNIDFNGLDINYIKDEEFFHILRLKDNTEACCYD